MPLLLEVEDLQVRYGRVDAVHGIRLRVEAGRIVTMIGANGAGKSTILNAIMGALPPNGSVSGRMRYLRQDLLSIGVEQRVLQGMCLVPETRELFTSMSVADNLLLGAYPRKKAGDRHYLDQLELVYGIFPRLQERARQQAGTLSGGERQMLAVGRALMSKPRLLMLDEPSLGLAPRIVREIFRIIVELRRSGVAILLIEQNARAALQVADYGYVLETGAISLQGPAQVLAKDPRVVETYLGLSKKSA